MQIAFRARGFAYIIFLWGLSSSGYSVGFRIPEQGTAAIARGNAFTATADDPSAVYYNPAGITQSDGVRNLLGVYTISLRARVSLDTPAEKDHFTNTNGNWQVAPESYYTWHPDNKPFAFGLGIYVPYGFAVDYPDDTPIRNVAHKGKIAYTTFNLVGALQLTRTLSLAIGPTISYSTATLEQGVIAKPDQFKFDGAGMTAGFNAGIMWIPCPMHHFGLTYRSATRVDYSGHTYVNTYPFKAGGVTIPGVATREDADAAIDFPQTITAGYSFRPTPDWNFEFDVDWADWGSLNTATIHTTSGDLALPFNWRSSFMYEFGITKQLSHGFHASCGYTYSQKSVPSGSFDPGVPDTNRHVFSVGFGQNYERFNWNVAYQFIYGPPRTISEGTISDGTYRFDAHALSFSLGYKF
ncbi:MAG: outer membrane protein transport protein [Chthoniobacter sp.]